MKHLDLKQKCQVAALTALCVTTAAWAYHEEGPISLSGDLDFLSVKSIDIDTQSALDEENEPADWTGDGFHVGTQRCGFVLYNSGDVPQPFNTPDECMAHFTITDAYNNEASSKELNLVNFLKTMKFTHSASRTEQIFASINRGGHYTFALEISPDYFLHEYEDDILDEACTRVDSTTTVIGLLLKPEIKITTGYPYDAASLSGEKTLHWSVSPDGKPNQILIDKTETFQFDTTQPLLASVVSFELAADNLAPGKYVYTLQSDFEGACRTFDAFVNDTVKADITLDKEIYDLDTDKEAKLTINMSYGYPYISKDSDTEESIITISTELLNETNNSTFSDPSWADAEINYTTEVTVPLDAITEDVVKENEGELPLTVSIIFNGNAQYKEIIGLPIKYDDAGVSNIEIGKASACPVYYNVFGVRVDSTYRGIVITSDGKKLINK